jgi:hypothetical protein
VPACQTLNKPYLQLHARNEYALIPAGAGMMAVPRAYLQVGWLLGTAMLLGVVSSQLAALLLFANPACSS